jgi:hypothetical protein
MKLVAMTLAILAATTATAQTVSLHPGESVTLRFENGKPVVERTAPAPPMTKFDAYALWRAETQNVPPGVKTVPPGFIMQEEGPPDPPAITPDRVELTMRQVPGPVAGSRLHTALTIRNGYTATFEYRAAMVVQDHTGPTDVCQVPSKLPGLEHWPYPIEQLDLSDLRLAPASDRISCQ